MKGEGLEGMVIKAIVFITTILLLLIFAESCKTPTTDMKPEINYKMDMLITNKQYEARGMIVLPEKELYSIILESKGKFNYFTFRTCSREVAKENASRRLNHYKVQVNYRPNLIERLNGCTVEVRGFEVKGRHSRGFIDFFDSSMTLDASLVCGASTKTWLGVSVCQERKGLIQSITFPSYVMYKTTPECEWKKKEGQVFEFEIKRGLCQYIFMEKVGGYRVHRLTTYGHEGILIRE